ncbi:MAG: DUF5662 family protein [bacterium]
MKLFKWYWIVFIHKYYVFKYALHFSFKLIKRALMHDFSKLRPSEAIGFSRLLSYKHKAEYGSREYHFKLNENINSINNHYKRNRHHPEFHKEGIQDMSLLDIIEMYVDWGAAIKVNQDGNIAKSIDSGTQRFGYGNTLKNIMLNSIKDFPNEKRTNRNTQKWFKKMGFRLLFRSNYGGSK